MIANAAATGDRRRTLEAMRDRLAADMDIAGSNVVAQIAARLQDVLRELDELPTGEEVSVSDDLARRRANRRAAAQAVAPSAGAGQ